jgi:hypothetical protein
MSSSTSSGDTQKDEDKAAKLREASARCHRMSKAGQQAADACKASGATQNSVLADQFFRHYVKHGGVLPMNKEVQFGEHVVAKIREKVKKLKGEHQDLVFVHANEPQSKAKKADRENLLFLLDSVIPTGTVCSQFV